MVPVGGSNAVSRHAADSSESACYIIRRMQTEVNSQSFGGGPLSEASGERLMKAGVKLQSVYGTTETGIVTDTFDAVERHAIGCIGVVPRGIGRDHLTITYPISYANTTAYDKHKCL